MRNIWTHLGSKLGEILFSLLSLLVASNSNAQGIIELSINGAPLAEKTVIDYIDNNREYSTDSKGRLQTEGSCPAIQYTDNNGMEVSTATRKKPVRHPANRATNPDNPHAVAADSTGARNRTPNSRSPHK